MLTDRIIDMNEEPMQLQFCCKIKGVMFYNSYILHQEY